MAVDTATITAAVNAGKIELDNHVDADVIILETARDGYKAELQTEKDELLVTANEVIAEGNSQVARVTTEGTAQVARVENTGTTEMSKLQALLDNAEDTGGNATALGGKTRAQFDSEIESRYQILGTDDKPLVYAFDPKNGAIGNSTQMSNQISQGNGTCLSDGEGLDGVIDEDGSFYCGEGYENIYDSSTIFAINDTSKATIMSYNSYEEGEWTVYEYVLRNLNREEGSIVGSMFYELRTFDDTTSRTTSYIAEPYPGFENLFDIQDGFSGMSGFYSYDNGVISLMIESTRFAAPQLPMVAQGVDTDVLYKWRVKKVIQTETSTSVPYVQNSAPNGRLFIKEPWTSETHSFILTNLTFSNFNGTNIIYSTINNAQTYADGEYTSFYLGDNAIEDASCLVSNTYKTLIKQDGSEKVVSLVKAGVSGAGILNLTREISKCSNTMVLFVYKGNLTETELRAEYEKIKSNKYIIPQEFIGTPHQIPHIPKKADSYGKTYESIEVADISRDLWLSTDEASYEIVDDNAVLYTAKVKSDRTIVGNGIEDVSGMLRITSDVALPCEIRRVR